MKVSKKRDQNSNLATAKDTGHILSPIERLSRALSDPTRLEIISILSTGSKSLDAIAKELKFDSFVQEAVLGKIGSEIYNEAKKTLPLRKCEIVKTRLLKEPPAA
jgi:DNA-binding transcriptional ArsR family regulator